MINETFIFSIFAYIWGHLAFYITYPFNLCIDNSARGADFVIHN